MREFLVLGSLIPLLCGCGAETTRKEVSAAPEIHAGEAAAEPLYVAAVRAARTATGNDPTSALDALQVALDAGVCPTRALTDEAFSKLHGTPRFRELIRDHARQASISMTLPGEAGERLRVRGVLSDREGRPIAGALIYAYHTDSRGLYSEGGMDERNPRIFGYMRSGAEGEFAFSTIRPAHYPDPEEPVEQHIHFEISAPGFAKKVTRTGFADDPFWSGKRIPTWAVPIERDEHGTVDCAVTIQLERAG